MKDNEILENLNIKKIKGDLFIEDKNIDKEIKRISKEISEEYKKQILQNINSYIRKLIEKIINELKDFLRVNLKPEDILVAAGSIPSGLQDNIYEEIGNIAK
ncbi:hypothetical protein CK556_01730 [Mesoplasma chauliocola]|uniref:Uncharacterized protein n=1 Tax=Mesoplasma chauliocola TaxID=216427 RepID=A0A249SN28_9MOLU|nr:hypothetical protein [Mesoplasma chauliocola]ASZ09075.1 hypothetical protein CK556_01730 [Mesoplasma chauliocola]